MINTDAYWYQMKFDQVNVLGKPGDDVVGPVYSFREMMNKHTVEHLATMAKSWTFFDKHLEKQTNGVENAYLILNSDLTFYPIL
ncbi:hypothetical protein SAMD00019534_115170 [Acytostelium subglobosum LB1]|uniref:hypothetical protein n=1 Tax=Acytostelium subglobosum LB1 TaxID=1410327 RepID=UPI0006449829|nr:hypothetical protein SAMD00019534_115170 [Acytostelium subglobosum LB1]GAM28341.1 hypothetical protein SAMD00019534_115170 [Acytostelium subglobosum LB1]|eukprot:XP_012748658.1 hypothetical protein SAMD00019534_115170 [Acytostelium subglobosum LB1]